MSTFTKQLLSGSTNGKQILVTVTTNGTAQTIHTATAGAVNFDEIWIYVYNENAGTVLFTLLWGGTTEPDNAIRANVPSQSGRFLICDGLVLQNGLFVKAYASIANAILIDGFVNHIVP